MMISERLKKLRQQRNLSQTELAKAFNMRVSSIRSYESGDRKPSNSVLIKYADFFRVTTDYLLGIDTKMTITLKDLDEEQIKSVQMLLETYRTKDKKRKK